MTYILIAEDDRDILLLIQRKLHIAGYPQVWGTNNGREAAEKALAQPPCLMILDVMLPELSGFQVCQQVKAALGQEAPPVIVITARGRSEDHAEGQAAGVDVYMLKPFSPRELIDQVRALLG